MNTIYTDINIYICIYTNLPVNAIVRLPDYPMPRAEIAMARKYFLAPSAQANLQL